MSLFAGLTSNYIFSLLQKDEPNIKQAIQNLDNIRTSLKLLDEYVIGQQEKFHDLSESISTMSKEKNSLETILSTERKQIEAVLQYTSSKMLFEKWVERGISFIIGVFASLTATFCVSYYRNKRQLAQQNDGADA